MVKGVISLKIDGKIIDENIIPLMPEAGVYKVEVVMG